MFGPKYVLPPACIKAIDQMLKLGDRLPAGQLQKLRTIAKCTFAPSPSAPDALLTPSKGLTASE